MFIMTFLEITFWMCCFLVIYPYAFYSSILRILSLWIKKGESSDSQIKDYSPSLTLIISAFNEEGIIAEKLNNALNLDYEDGKLAIIVISDASEDKTDEIVAKFSKENSKIQLFRQEVRKGKTAGINAAIADVVSNLVVFSDANSMYKPDALKELVKSFNNPKVGYVVGAAKYKQDKTSLANQSESIYWNNELELKKMESDICSVVGGDGAIYAIRRELFAPLSEDDINDFANPLQIIAQGYRGLFNPAAICFEHTAEDFQKEYHRKRRIVNRSFRSLCRHIGEFNLSQHKLFLFLLFSHKVLRWFSMFFITSATLCALVLSLTSPKWIYQIFLTGIVLTIIMALLGSKLSKTTSLPKPLFLLYYFYLVNVAAMLGIVDNLLGRYHVTWDHVRK